MPTTVTKTIKASGGDYSTIAGWEADTDDDLVTADEVRVGEVYASMSPITEFGVVMGGATVDSTRYRVLRVRSADRHDGKSGGVLWSVGGTPADDNLSVSEDYAQVLGFNFDSWDTGFFAIVLGGDFNRVAYCLFHDNTGLDSAAISWGNARLKTAYIYNCAFWNLGGAAIRFGGTGVDPQGNTAYVYNCTAHDCCNNLSGSAAAKADKPVIGVYDNGTVSNDTIIYCVNCAVDSGDANAPAVQGGGSGGVGGGSGVVDIRFSAVNDTSISTALNVTDSGNNTESVVFTSEIVSNNDPHINAASSSVLLNGGTNLSSDPNLAFGDDYEEGVRGSVWDIGADETGGPVAHTVSVSDNLTITDTSIGSGVTNFVSKRLSDSITLSSNVAEGFTLFVSDTITLTDIVSLEMDPILKVDMCRGLVVKAPPTMSLHCIC